MILCMMHAFAWVHLFASAHSFGWPSRLLSVFCYCYLGSHPILCHIEQTTESPNSSCSTIFLCLKEHNADFSPWAAMPYLPQQASVVHFLHTLLLYLWVKESDLDFLTKELFGSLCLYCWHIQYTTPSCLSWLPQDPYQEVRTCFGYTWVHRGQVWHAVMSDAPQGSANIQ